MILKLINHKPLLQLTTFCVADGRKPGGLSETPALGRVPSLGLLPLVQLSVFGKVDRQTVL